MLTILSSILIVLSFPPWNYSFLIFFAFVPYLVQVSRLKTAGQAVRHSMLLGFLMTMGGFYWVAYSIQHYGGIPTYLSYLGLLIFGLVCQPQFPVFGWVFYRWTQGRTFFSTRLLLGLSLVYAGVDWLSPKLFQDTFGHSTYLNPYIRQGADLGGAHLLTFMIVFFNLSLWKAWVEWRNHKSLVKARIPLGLAVVFLLCNTIYGAYRYESIHSQLARDDHPRIALAAIQANIGDFDKIAAEQGLGGAGNKVIESYLRLSRQALTLEPRPQAVIWPETAYPSAFRQPRVLVEQEHDQRLERFVRENRVPLLFGGYDFDAKSSQDSNAFFFLHPQPIPMPRGPDHDLRVYRKNVLLMFGEYLPGADWIPQLKSFFPQMGFFLRGPGAEVLDVQVTDSAMKFLKVGPIICYEALFPNYILEAARKGSQLILNITNDSWFGPYGEPDLHFALTTFRGIESRLPQLRATNTGISALVLPDGDIQVATPIFKEAVMNVQIPVLPKMKTLMLILGDWFGYFSAVTGCLLLWTQRKRLHS